MIAGVVSYTLLCLTEFTTPYSLNTQQEWHTSESLKYLLPKRRQNVSACLRNIYLVFYLICVLFFIYVFIYLFISSLFILSVFIIVIYFVYYIIIPLYLLITKLYVFSAFIFVIYLFCLK